MFGIQMCENGRWGACMVDATRGTLSVPAPPPVLPSTSRLGLMSVGGSAVDCDGNVCNPQCQVFDDEPDKPHEADRVEQPTGWTWGGTLDSSNVPPAFKNKGSLDAQCGAAEGSQEWNEACQFDQHCVDGQCVAFQPGESGSCSGVDITAPTTCVPAGGDYRDLTVCNRGTVVAPAGIKCYRYSGGSPQFPNDDPGLGQLVMTTAAPIEPGACETQRIPESVFHQNGIQSIGCNPPDEALVTVTAGTSYPAANVPSTGSFSWTSPDNAYAADDAFTTATPANPNGTTVLAAPSAHTSFGSDGSFSDAESALGASADGAYASATPVLPGAGAGTVGPNYPGSYRTPAVDGDASFSNPTLAYIAGGLHATASPPATSATETRDPSSHGGTWSNLGNTYTADGSYATVKLTSAGTADGYVGGFGLSLPDDAVVDSLTLSVKWKTDVNSKKYTLTAQLVTGSTNTTIGSELTKSSSYVSESTNTSTLSAATLSAFPASAFNDPNLKVRLRFKRGNGNVTASTASVDHVQIAIAYHVPSTAASVVYTDFPDASLPSGANATLTAEVKWKTSTTNSNVVFGMQVYKGWNSTPTALGTEVTRTPAAAKTDYVDSSAPLAVAPADLVGGSLAVRLRVQRHHGGSNPDVTASIDYVRLTVAWTTGGSPVTHSIYLTGFGLQDRIPANATITNVTTSARWKLSAPTTRATLGLQSYKDGGTVGLGTETTDTSGPTSATTATHSVSGGLSPADLHDSRFGVRVRVTRDSTASANPDFTALLDFVTVAVSWTSPDVTHAVTFGNFGLHVPSDAVVTQIKTEVRWKSSASTGRARLGFQPFVDGGATAVGGEDVDSGAPTSLTTRVQTLSGLSLSADDLANGNFVVKLRITRTSGSSNPDFTASVDFVRVTVSYDELQDAAVQECNASNNWTATKLNPSPDACQDMSTPQYVPFTVSRVFQAVCPEGAGPVWRNFDYTTSTPAGTKVEFRFRSFAKDESGMCATLPAITAGDPEPLATASSTEDPAVCAIGVGEGCPVDLYEGLGGLPDAAHECLQMDAYGVPTSSASAQLIDWAVYYDCAANQ